MSIAAFVADLERRDVHVRLDEGGLGVDAPAGGLTDEDRAAIRARRVLLAVWLRAQGRRPAPVVLSAAWPRAGSWQHRYAVEGRHPLVCASCGGRTLRPLGDGQIGCPTCAAPAAGRSKAS